MNWLKFWLAGRHKVEHERVNRRLETVEETTERLELRLTRLEEEEGIFQPEVTRRQAC